MRLGALLATVAIVQAVALLGHPGDHTTITVRFVDARNGKPYTLYRGPWQIHLFRADPTGKSPTRAYMKANDMGTIRVFSDANGKAAFTLPSPIPAVIWFESPLGCSHESFDAIEVVEKGIVGKNECRTKFAKEHNKFQATPGEIIYLVAPLSFWERHPLIR
ncbi:MAG: hypothetical protein ACRD3T_15425 [Terriglobia bacterium]